MAEPAAIPTGTPQKFSLGFAISKVDKANRIVSGIATIEQPDRQGDIVGYDGSVRAFTGWVGNIREQHDPKKAVGKAIQWNPLPDQKAIAVDVYVSKSRDGEDALTKVEEGILRGFSIQGNIRHSQPIVQKTDDGSSKNFRFIKDYDLDELSLVDNPACPGALITMVKSADGHLVATDALGTVDEQATPDAPTPATSSDPPSASSPVSETPAAVDTAASPSFTPEQIRDAIARKAASENAKTFGVGLELPPISATRRAAQIDTTPAPALPTNIPAAAMTGTLTDAIRMRKAMEVQAEQAANAPAAAPTVTPREPAISASALEELRASLTKRDEAADQRQDIDARIAALVDQQVQVAVNKALAKLAKATTATRDDDKPAEPPKPITARGRILRKAIDDYGWRGSPDVQIATSVLQGLDALLKSETDEAKAPDADADDREQLDSLKGAVSGVLAFLTAELAEYYGSRGEEPPAPISYAAGQRSNLRKAGARHNADDASDVQAMHDTAVRLGAVCQYQSAPTEDGPERTYPSQNPALKSAATAAEEFDDVNADQIIKAVNANTNEAIQKQLGGLASKDDLRKAVEVLSQLDARLKIVEAQPVTDPNAPAAFAVPVEKALGGVPSGVDDTSDAITLYRGQQPQTFSKADVDRLEVEWRTTSDAKRRQEIGMTLALVDMKRTGVA